MKHPRSILTFIFLLFSSQNAIKFMVEEGRPLKDVTTKDFAGAVVDAVLRMDLSDSIRPARLFIPVDEVGFDGDRNATPMSNLTNDSVFASGELIGIPYGAPTVPDYFLKQHTRQKLPQSDRRQRARLDCKLRGCKQRSGFRCVGCNKVYCVPEGCRGGKRYCFYIHVADAFIRSGYAGLAFRAHFHAWHELIRADDGN